MFDKIEDIKRKKKKVPQPNPTEVVSTIQMVDRISYLKQDLENKGQKQTKQTNKKQQ